MPHIIREEHLEDICAQCKKPHGNNMTVQLHHHKVYESIMCISCGYETIRVKTEKEFEDKLLTFHKV